MCVKVFFPARIFIVADVMVTRCELNADAASRTFLAVLFEGKTKKTQRTKKRQRFERKKRKERAAASGQLTDDDDQPYENELQ